MYAFHLCSLIFCVSLPLCSFPDFLEVPPFYFLPQLRPSALYYKESHIPVLTKLSKTMSSPPLRWPFGIEGCFNFNLWASEEGQAFTKKKMVVGYSNDNIKILPAFSSLLLQQSAIENTVAYFHTV